MCSNHQHESEAEMATYLELKQKIEELQREAEALKANERQGVIERMKEAISVYEITAQELGLGGRSGSPRGQSTAKKGASRAKSSKKSAEPRTAYADGKGNTWGGRGPRPKWLKDALANGGSLEQFAQS
jgi:DNA-binding protein H-NS